MTQLYIYSAGVLHDPVIFSLQAVCCDDRHHCCPEATKCDIAHLRCVSASLESFPLLAKLPARRRGNNPGGDYII